MGDVNSVWGAGAAIMGAVLMYFAGRRSTSGTVTTSNAAELWANVNTHLERLDKTVISQGVRISELGLEVHAKDERIMHLEGENTRLKLRVNELELEIKLLQSHEKGAAK